MFFIRVVVVRQQYKVLVLQLFLPFSWCSRFSVEAHHFLVEGFLFDLLLLN